MSYMLLIARIQTIPDIFVKDFAKETTYIKTFYLSDLPSCYE
ncbi:2904_t:CDS:2, partial [Cetraspora pellucida]